MTTNVLEYIAERMDYNGKFKDGSAAIIDLKTVENVILYRSYNMNEGDVYTVNNGEITVTMNDPKMDMECRLVADTIKVISDIHMLCVDVIFIKNGVEIAQMKRGGVITIDKDITVNIYSRLEDYIIRMRTLTPSKDDKKDHDKIEKIRKIVKE